MLKRSAIRRGKNYEDWPWPVKLPFKKGWFRHYTPSSTQSISREIRGIQTVGDLAVVSTICFIAFRVYHNITSHTYKTRLRQTTGMPPALVAQDFDFENVNNNRKLTREELDKYREEFVSQRGSGRSLENWIFKY